MARPAVRTDEVLSPQEERIKKGFSIGLVSSKGQSKRSRINRMLQGFRDQPIRIDVERAQLFTDSFKETEGQPIVLRWAMALANILKKHTIHIESEEIIVGSAGPPGRYTIIYPELAGSIFSTGRGSAAEPAR